MFNFHLHLILKWSLFCCVFCFNIDTKFPILFNGTANSYFGYNVALLRNGGGDHVLITAPRANSTGAARYVRQPGILLSCKISFKLRNQICKEVELDKGTAPKRGRDGNLPYEDLKDDMFLGVSLDIQQNTENGHVVTCGHLWKNQVYSEIYLVNGVCYVINKELDENSVQKLLPLVQKPLQSLQGVYYYAFGQAGTSVAFSEDGKHLLMGTPGFYDWTGGVLSYSAPRYGHTFTNPVLPGKPALDLRLSPESYIGYSVTSGRFFENPENFIAVGAPRDKNSYGQVYIVKMLKSQSDKFSVHLKKAGTQFGEYFGASVMAVNLNHDQFTDLLIGAPFYSSDTGGDEGRVYVYVSNGVGLQFYAKLYGDNKPNARFGSCISAIGDINQDRYNDVAIGAPYEEESGAVYIFHGTSTGVAEKYSQKITASEISTGLAGFGFSISRGMDTDNNYYPDLLIGAYASSHAVLLRSHPIVSFVSRLEFDPPKINMNSTECDFDGDKVVCVNITACVQYTERHGSNNLDIWTVLHMDLGKLNALSPPRGYFLDNGKQTSMIRRAISLDIGKDSCVSHTGYIRSDAKDVITPIDFLFEYELIAQSTNTEFCKNCPVINSNSPTNISKSILFQTGCGKDNQCLSNLVVKAVVADNPENNQFVIGKITTLTLDIEVTNVGEPAYLSELYIYLPEVTPNINQDFCTALTDQQKQETNASLQCDLGNPLRKNQMVNVQIKIDMSKLPADIEKVIVTFEAKTASTEVEPNDNVLDLPLTFKSISDVSITGIADNEQIQFHFNKDEKSSVITHTYFIMNHGPSPVNTIDIDILVPISIPVASGFIDFLSFTQLEADSGQQLTIPAKCNDSSIELLVEEPDVKKSKDGVFDEDLIEEKGSRISRDAESLTTESDEGQSTSRSKKSLSDNTSNKRKDLIVDCKKARCMLIQCSASPFTNSRKFAKISLSLQLKSSVLNEKLEPWYRIEFVTQGKISIRGEMGNIQPEFHQPDETTIKTILIRPGPPPSQEIAKWIIFASIGIGVLLLIVILITLIKIGFFKRQQKDKMRQMLMQADLKEWDPNCFSEEMEGTTDENIKHT